MNKGKEELLRQQFEELQKQFSGLKLCEDSPGEWVIRGILHFTATYNEVTIEDGYSIRISIPEDYPDSPPDIQETGGRIPPDFHQHVDRRLCLTVPVEANRRFKSNPNLLTFVKTLVVDYLYGYSHLEKYGALPFGDFPHGGPGLQKFYSELFKTEDIRVILALLKIMADDSYRGHHACPCGSGEILRKCHGPILIDLMKNQTKDRFINDSILIISELSKKGFETLTATHIPKQYATWLDNYKREELGESKKSASNIQS